MKTSKLLIALLLTSSSVFAEDGKFYIGASGGKSYVDGKISALTGTANEDDDDTAWKIYTGYQWDNNFGIELHYADLGDYALSGNNGDTFVDATGTTFTFIANGVKLTEEVISYGASLTYSVPLMDTGFFVPLKVGFHHWDIDYADDLTGSGEDDNDLTYGVGLAYEFNENFAIRAEYERFQLDSDDIDDIDLVTAGLTVSF